MSQDLPDYAAVEPPADKSPEQYSVHERRGQICSAVYQAGSPNALNQTQLADHYGVTQPTIHRDLERIRESIDANLGKNAKLETRALFHRLRTELMEEDDWRAKKACFDAALEFNEWLADTGHQHREPDRSELEIDADVRSRHSEVAYEVVRETDDDPLPTDGDGEPDYEAAGFLDGPAGVEVEATDDLDGGDS